MCHSPTGVLEVSGLVVHFNETKPAGQRIESVLVGGKPLDEARSYKIATNSFLAGGGDGHKMFQAGRDRRDEGVLVRDLLQRHFQGKGKLDPGPLDARLVSSSGK